MLTWGKKILGIDLGSRAIKGAVLSRKGKDIYLADYLYHDVKATPFPQFLGDSQQELIQALVEGKALHRYQASGCLEDKEVQVAHLTLPVLSEKEIEAAVRNKVEAKTGAEASELSIQHVVVGQISSNGNQELLVRVYFTKMEAVRRQASLLEGARLVPVSLESCLQATIEALKFNDYINANDTCIVADIGESHTSLGLVIGGNLAQLNAIRVGSGDINENLMKSFQCSYDDCEKMKLEYRLEKGDPGAAENMNRVIEDGYYNIILGIHDTATYYKAAFKDQLIVNLLLTGGGSQKEGLAALMEQSLNIPTLVPNPLRKIQIFGGEGQNREDLPKIAPSLHPAIGLALRGVA